MRIPFTVHFKPQQEHSDIRSDNLLCSIKGGKDVRLTLTGSCVAIAPKETVNFNTIVRGKDTKTITIANKSNESYILKPNIGGEHCEYWTGSDTLVVEPHSSKGYELLYRPFTMTSLDNKHEASIFFALPDGNAYQYKLTGQADPPKVISIKREIPSKISYTEVLNVSNWLKTPQKFKVFIEIVKPEKPDPATTLKGLEYIDVPGLTKKEYKLDFYAHKEGILNSKVTFKNEKSGEYHVYAVNFTVGSPGSIGTVELITPVRKSTSHIIAISNPLGSVQVNFLVTCNIQEVEIPPALSIPPLSEGCLTFNYTPLKPGVTSGKLILTSTELGVYIYDLNLTATEAARERPVHFVTTLGSQQIQSCKFINYAKSKIDYTPKVNSKEFMVDKSSIPASASEVVVEVTFEPSCLGECQAILTVSSPIGGEYTFPLHGHCLPPKPQGPYTVKAGSVTSIPFKNVFAEKTSFTFHMDNPSFTCKPEEDIRGKKTHSILVSLDSPQGDSKSVRMGRLVVSCARSVGTGSNLSWTFYLRGVTN